MVKGVTEGFTKKMELVGVGYKAANTGNILDLASVIHIISFSKYLKSKGFYRAVER
jgi:ribosomal protein L6P/L9E